MSNEPHGYMITESFTTDSTGTFEFVSGSGSGASLVIDNSWVQGNVIVTTSSKRKTFWGKKNTKNTDLQVRAFLKIVKKGLTRLEKKHYEKLAEEAFEQAVEHTDVGQTKVAEQFVNIMNANLKKASADLRGYDTFIHTKMIDKYRENLPINKQLVIDDLEEYEKPLPKHVKVKLCRARKEKIFDSFCVFWIQEIKDPILFGQIKEEPDMYFFIDEWDDDISVKDLLKWK